MPIKTTVYFLRDVLQAAQISGSRSRLDIFADRLAKAASEPALTLAMESLLRSVDVNMNRLSADCLVPMVTVASSADAPRVLRWLREQTKLITLLAATNSQEMLHDALQSLELPTPSGAGSAAKRQAYQIPIVARCETPLAHGSDAKAGNATLFRRIQVLADNGNVLNLPYYSGNAVRGQIRDLMADHFLESLGLSNDRSKPVISLWFFYALYSGGALEEKSDATKALTKQLGDNGAIKAEGIRAFREMLPGLSLLGCALGNRVLPGHVQFADLRPLCSEWGTGDRSIAEMLTWEFLTRREDYEDHDKHHGMIANTEVLRTGVSLEGGVDMDSATPELQRSALGRGLLLLQQRGMLGAENRRGFGRVKIEMMDCPDGAIYDAWLAEHKSEILDYLSDLGALAE